MSFHDECITYVSIRLYFAIDAIYATTDHITTKRSTYGVETNKKQNSIIHMSIWDDLGDICMF
jgi:hypothetical protein